MIIPQRDAGEGVEGDGKYICRFVVSDHAKFCGFLTGDLQFLE